MYGARFVPMTVLPSTSQSPHCVQMGGGGCDVIPPRHLGTPGSDVIACLEAFQERLFWVN